MTGDVLESLRGAASTNPAPGGVSLAATPERSAVTQDLIALAGEADDRVTIEERLNSHVYDELRGIARAIMRQERPDLTLRPTELVHEAYLRLVNSTAIPARGRAYFFGAAARAMRRILVDQARRREAGKRGGSWQRITLKDDLQLAEVPIIDLLTFDQALSRLAALDPRMARIAELRVFAGISRADIACALDVSERTVDGDWAVAKRWLRRELSGT